MLSVAEIRKANEELARQINDEARRDPTSPYAGKFVGIANGQVVAVGDNWDQMGRRLRVAEPDPAKTLCLEAGGDGGAAEEFWLTPQQEERLSRFSEVRKINEDLARKINAEARRDPTSPYAGKIVGIANGQVVVVADDWDEVRRRLDEVEPEPLKCFCVEASVDYDQVYEIGEFF